MASVIGHSKETCVLCRTNLTANELYGRLIKKDDIVVHFNCLVSISIEQSDHHRILYISMNPIPILLFLIDSISQHIASKTVGMTKAYLDFSQKIFEIPLRKQNSRDVTIVIREELQSNVTVGAVLAAIIYHVD